MTKFLSIQVHTAEVRHLTAGPLLTGSKTETIWAGWTLADGAQRSTNTLHKTHLTSHIKQLICKETEYHPSRAPLPLQSDVNLFV